MKQSEALQELSVRGEGRYRTRTHSRACQVRSKKGLLNALMSFSAKTEIELAPSNGDHACTLYHVKAL